MTERDFVTTISYFMITVVSLLIITVILLALILWAVWWTQSGAAHALPTSFPATTTHERQGLPALDLIKAHQFDCCFWKALVSKQQHKRDEADYKPDQHYR
jgi:hypothetical protein